MFFIGIFGVDSKVVPAGQFSAGCPICGRKGVFSLCRSYNYLHAFFLPLYKYHNEYLATCAGCASVFALDPALGRRSAQGEAVRIRAADLRLLRSNFHPTCPACGAQQPQNSSYCNQCGAKL